MAQENGGQITLPRQHAPYLYDWFNRAGPAQSGGMGPAPLSAAELTAWAEGAGITLQPWEFHALREASRAYVGELLQPSEWPPHGSPDDLYDDDTVAAKLMRGLGTLRH